MRKLLLLVIVAAMCVPCYGGILVYKTSTSATVFTGDVKEVQKDRGYLVLDVDFDTQTVNSAQQITYGDAEQETTVVSVEFSTPTGFIVADYSGNDKDAILFGKATLTDIGLAGNETVAKSLKGSMLVGLGTADLGTGTYSAKLDTKRTKAANGVEDTIAEVVADIVAFLEDKYVPITDSTAPTPNPMTFASDPNATSTTTITMTATTATDAGTEPVEYFFTNVTDTNHNSGWQSSAIFTDSSLTPDTNYIYTVKARDSAAVPNETADSNQATARTLRTEDTNAPDPNRMEWATGGEPNGISATEITMTAALATDAQGIDGYYFTCVNDGNFNSGWKSASEDSTNWTASTRTYIATGLNPSTSYGFTVKARDRALVTNVTADSNVGYATTLADATAPTPDPMTWATVPEANGATAIYMAATPATDDTNSATVEYSFENILGGGNSSGWITNSWWQDTGLDANTEYAYRVRARDASGNTTGYSTIETATTGLTIAMMIADQVAARTGNEPVTVTIAAGTYAEDLTITDPNVTLTSASGAAATIIQLVDGVGITIDGGADAFILDGFTIEPNAAGGTTFAVQLTNAPTDVNIANNIIDINTTTASMAISVGAAGAESLTIIGNNITIGSGDGAIWGVDVNSVSVLNNTINGPADAHITSGYGIQFAGITGASLINGNTLTNTGSGIFITGAQPGPSGTAVAKNVTILGNTITQCQKGIRLGHSTQTTNMDDIYVTGNTLQSNVVGLYVDTHATLIAADTFDVNENSFLDNTDSGLENADANSLPAELNWWGAASGPYHTANTGGLGDKIVGTVDFNPWYITSAKDVNSAD